MFVEKPSLTIFYPSNIGSLDLQVQAYVYVQRFGLTTLGHNRYKRNSLRKTQQKDRITELDFINLTWKINCM